MKNIINYFRALKLALSIAWVKDAYEIEDGIFESDCIGWKTAWKVAKDIWIK